MTIRSLASCLPLGLSLGLSCVLCIAPAALAVGPDIVLSDSGDVARSGPTGGLVGYAIGSNTCNIGNQNLTWAFDGTPGLAMNVYRLKDGRLMQLGASFVKHACCAAAGSGCGACNGQGGNVLGAGCLDVYGGGWNAGISFLGPRSGINAYTGAFSTFADGAGNAIYKQAQCNQADMLPASNPGAQYFIEGVYVSTEDAAARNTANNATYKRVTVNASTDLTPTGAPMVGIPAIRAWRDHGGGVNTADPSVTIGQADFAFPPEGRFWHASKVRDLGGGRWRYEYAVFNLNSDAAGGSFEVLAPSGITISNIGWSAPRWHSGEVYNNDAWTSARTYNRVRWQTAQPVLVNANANAIRWGIMHNFWFDADQPPNALPQPATLGAFKTNNAAFLTVPVPGATLCNSIDLNSDGVFPDSADVEFFLDLFSGPCLPPFVCPSIDFNNDGVFPDVADIEALLRVLAGGVC